LRICECDLSEIVWPRRKQTYGHHIEDKMD
jgi:hypothetical protein